MAERLEEGSCIDGCAEKKGTYEMPGACFNCGIRYTLVIARTHEVPGSLLGWRCPNCGCTRIGAVSRPAEPQPEGRTAEHAVVEAARQWKEARELAHEFGGRFARERVGGFERDLVDALAALDRSLSTEGEARG